MNLKLIFAAAAASLFAATSANAITWGKPDNNEHPNVGTLLFVQNGVGFYSCTGTLIAPRVMLTAGHCVEGDGELNNLTYVRFDEDAISDIVNYNSLQDWFNNEWIAVDQVIAHPQWDDYAEFPHTYDVGVVILAEDVYPANGFATIPTLGFLESLSGGEKQNFLSVGYGRQGTLKPFEMDDYVRYKGKVRILEVNSYLTGAGDSVKFSNNPGVGGGTCYGDSGGPTFFQDTNILVSITSFGWAKNGNCIGNDYNYRTDIPAAQDFINDVLSTYGN